tara:strand:- start:32 stop:226 length:195 start_codon:yes stop_codon:yes gene_type:complete
MGKFSGRKEPNHGLDVLAHQWAERISNDQQSFASDCDSACFATSEEEKQWLGTYTNSFDYSFNS